MEKNLFNKVFTTTEVNAENANCTPEFLNALNANDKSVGTSAQLAKGDKVKLLRFDYVDGHRTIGEDAYAEMPETSDAERSAKRRYVRNADGTYTVDNSYYACLTEGAATSVSFRALTSGALFKSEAPAGTLLLNGGRASDVAKALIPYIGKTLEVVGIRPYNEGDLVNGRKSRFEGRSIFFKVCDEPAPSKKNA